MENVLERAFNVVEGDLLERSDLPIYFQKTVNEVKKVYRPQSLQTTLEDTEKAAIIAALEATGNNKVQAAKMLEISRAWLYQRMKKHSIFD